MAVPFCMEPIRGKKEQRDTIEPAPISPPSAFPVVALAASAGGLQALSVILSALPADFSAPIVIVQHISADHPSQMAVILNRSTSLRVKEAEAGDRLEAGWVYVAPPAHHLLVRRDRTLSLSVTPKVHFVRPSADVLFESVAASAGAGAIGVVLTGGDGDGAAGIQDIRKAGGVTIAQDEATSQHFSMPRHAIATGDVDYVLPLEEIAPMLVKLTTLEK